MLMGIGFGFLLQKGGVGKYDVIIGQLLLTNFTVLKVMLTAVAVGMVGVYSLKAIGLAQLHIKPGSVGSTILGGLIFGAGFAILGYCPGTVLVAAASGSLDAMVAGVTGTLVGTWLFAVLYPVIEGTILNKGAFRYATIPELLKVNCWAVIVPLCLAICGLLVAFEEIGW
jgi:hypothetical protein